MTVAVRIGLIGAGTMGGLHARVVATSERTELAWIADPNPATQATADRYSTRWVPEPELGVVDAVIIAAPTQLHRDLALDVVEQGFPLLLEKPIADTYAGVVEVVEAAQKRGQVLMCGLLERFNAAVRTAADIARAPLHVSTVRHSPYSERIRTGVASDLLIHDIDLVLRLFGETPSASSGHFGFFDPRSMEASEDVADATMQFGGGQLASLSVSRISQHKVRSVRITELGRVIEVDLLRQDITVLRHVQEATFDEDAGYRQQTIIDIPVVRYTGEPLQLQLNHFLGLLDGTGDPAAELATLLPPHAVLRDVTESARRHRGG